MHIDSRPTFELTLADYFRERLLQFGEQLRPCPHEDTLWYLGSLLARFGSSDQLFCYDNGEITLRPLALLYKDARESSNHHQRCLLLRQLGDLALFIGGLFPENYARRGIHKDYFVGMGGGAYDYLADNAQQNRHIFSELAAMFAKLLELVRRVCFKQNQFDATDILHLYQRWQQTRDPVAAQQLRHLGICTTSSNTLQ